MNKEELIDFLKWLKKYPYSYDAYSYKFVADDYLKSINSAPCERKADSNNEAQEKLCPVCNGRKYFLNASSENGIEPCVKCKGTGLND